MFRSRGFADNQNWKRQSTEVFPEWNRNLLDKTRILMDFAVAASFCDSFFIR